MKFVFGDIVSFIPLYSEKDGFVEACQVIKYDEEKRRYLVIPFDLYCMNSADNYYLTEVEEKDIESIKNTFLKDDFAYNQVIFGKDMDLNKIKKTDIYKLNAAAIDFVTNRKLYVDYSDYRKKHEHKL